MAELAAFDSAGVTRMIEERRFDEAAARVDEVLTADPSNLLAMLSRLRLFIAVGQTAEAVALSERLTRKFPRNKWVAAGRIDALLAAGDLPAARESFLGMEAPTEADAPLVTRMITAVTQADPDRASRIALLEKAAEAWPGSQAVLTKLALQTYLDGRGQDAAAILAKAEALGPLPAYTKTLREALLTASGDHAAAVEALSATEATNPGDSETTRRLVRMLAAAGRFDDAAEKLSEALDRWPLDWLVLYRLNRTFLTPQQDAAVFAELKATLDTGEPTALWRLQFAQFAQRAGHTDLAAEILRELSDGTAASHIAAPNLAALERALADGAGPSRVDLDMTRDVTIVRADDAVATVVVFGSLVGGIGHLPFTVVDPMLARLPVNVVYLRDRSGMAFLRGVASLGPNEATTVTALRILVAGLGAKRIVTTGSSISGYSATRYGLAMGADATVSFAGPTALAQGRSDSRNASLGMEEIQAVARGSGDLADRIAAAEDFTLTLVVGSDFAPDARSAEKVAALANVNIVELPGVEHHFAALAAIAQGRYLPLLESAINEGADAPD